MERRRKEKSPGSVGVATNTEGIFNLNGFSRGANLIRNYVLKNKSP